MHNAIARLNRLSISIGGSRGILMLLVESLTGCRLLVVGHIDIHGAITRFLQVFPQAVTRIIDQIPCLGMLGLDHDNGIVFIDLNLDVEFTKVRRIDTNLRGTQAMIDQESDPLTDRITPLCRG